MKKTFDQNLLQATLYIADAQERQYVAIMKALDLLNDGNLDAAARVLRQAVYALDADEEVSDVKQ